MEAQNVRPNFGLNSPYPRWISPSRMRFRLNLPSVVSVLGETRRFMAAVHQCLHQPSSRCNCLFESTLKNARFRHSLCVQWGSLHRPRLPAAPSSTILSKSSISQFLQLETSRDWRSSRRMAIQAFFFTRTSALD